MSLASAASPTLISVGEIPLAKTDGQIDQALPTLDGGWLVRDSNAAAPEKQAIELYDSRGARVRSIGAFGQNPGQYFRLREIGLAQDGIVWAADILGRVSFFTLAGALQGTLLVQNPGYQVDSLVLPPGNEFFLGGCLPKKTYLEDGCTLAHRYRRADRGYVASFVSSSPVVPRDRLMSLQEVVLAADAKGRIFVADAPVFEVSRVDPATGTIVTWALPKQKAPPAGAGADGRAGAYEASNRIRRMVALGDHLAVSVGLPGASDSWLTLLDSSGRAVLAEQQVPGTLVGAGGVGELLFARRDSRGWKLVRMKVEGLAGSRGPR